MCLVEKMAKLSFVPKAAAKDSRKPLSAATAMPVAQMVPFFLYTEGLTLLYSQHVDVDISDLTNSVLVEGCSGTFQARS